MIKLQADEAGFGAVEGLIIALVVVVIGFAGYLVLHAQKSKKHSVSPVTTSVSKPATPLEGKLSYANSDRLSGWIEDHQQGSKYYSLNNDALGCYVGVGVDKPKMGLSSLQPLPGTPSRKVTLGSGQTVTVYDSGMEKDYKVSEGWLVENNFDVDVRVACMNKANYPSADIALKSIRLE